MYNTWSPSSRGGLERAAWGGGGGGGGGIQLQDKELHTTVLVKPPIKDTPKEDKPPNKGQAKSTLVYTQYRKSPLKQDNLSTKDRMTGPKSVLHCISLVYTARLHCF